MLQNASGFRDSAARGRRKARANDDGFRPSPVERGTFQPRHRGIKRPLKRVQLRLIRNARTFIATVCVTSAA